MALLDRFKKKEKKEKPEFKREELPVEKKPLSSEKKKPAQPMRMVNKKETIKAYRIVKEPHITEKATWLAEQNKHVFKVATGANKIEIKKAVESLYGVKVDRVRIIHIAPKKRRLGRHQGYRKGLKQGFKKAIVTLKKGQKIELLAK